ncbi:hypothetical protein D3C87_956640 [compost metagenome]|uniref:hypothetical protein n=1 Tax=Variovorax boronicumulans TaxID=436515 RepID=UPI000F94F46D
MNQECGEARSVAVRRRLISIRSVGAILIASASFLASAQVPPIMQAGYTADACAQLLKGTGRESLHQECVTRVSAFMAGWIKGIRRGLSYAAIEQRSKNDKRSERELAEVVRAMFPDATCLSKTKFKQIAQGFVDYVAANPSRSSESYDDVLADYFLDKLCN